MHQCNTVVIQGLCLVPRNFPQDLSLGPKNGEGLLRRERASYSEQSSWLEMRRSKSFRDVGSQRMELTANNTILKGRKVKY